MNQIIIDRLDEIRDEIERLLSNEDVPEIDDFPKIWQERDQLLKKLCQSKHSLIEHRAIIEAQLSLTHHWLARTKALSDKLGKDLLSSTRNQKAIRKYQR